VFIIVVLVVIVVLVIVLYMIDCVFLLNRRAVLVTVVFLQNCTYVNLNINI